MSVWTELYLVGCPGQSMQLNWEDWPYTWICARFKLQSSQLLCPAGLLIAGHGHEPFIRQDSRPHLSRNLHATSSQHLKTDSLCSKKKNIQRLRFLKTKGLPTFGGLRWHLDFSASAVSTSCFGDYSPLPLDRLPCSRRNKNTHTQATLSQRTWVKVRSSRINLIIERHIELKQEEEKRITLPSTSFSSMYFLREKNWEKLSEVPVEGVQLGSFLGATGPSKIDLSQRPSPCNQSTEWNLLSASY